MRSIRRAVQVCQCDDFSAACTCPSGGAAGGTWWECQLEGREVSECMRRRRSGSPGRIVRAFAVSFKTWSA